MKIVLFMIFLLICFSGQSQMRFSILSPSQLHGNYQFSTTSVGWGCPNLDSAGSVVLGELMYDEQDSLFCNADNDSSFQSKIVLIYRGDCEFSKKALNAQLAGAVAVIIINNTTDPVSMSSGSFGSSVHIPVIMISPILGADIINALKTGNVIGLIGNKSGFFDNDLSLRSDKIIKPSKATYATRLTESTNTKVEPGLWIFNNGSKNQTSITVSAEIKINHLQSYKEIIVIDTLRSSDSVYISFPTFSTPPGIQSGSGNLSYLITSSSEEQDPGDNDFESTFNLTPWTYSYSDIDSTSGLVNYTKFANTGQGKGPSSYCISFIESRIIGSSELRGVSFAIEAIAPHNILGEPVVFDLFEWRDIFSEPDSAAFNDLISIVSEEYIITSINSKKIYLPFSPVSPLKQQQRFLACISLSNDSVKIGLNDKVDYTQNVAINQQPLSVAKDQLNGWYRNGFGHSVIPAIALHFSTIISVNENILTSTTESSFPTPSNDYVNIPFKSEGANSASIQIMDVTGKLVGSTSATVSGASLRVNTTQLSNGTYLFNVTLDNGKTAAFRVMVGR